MCLQLEMHVCHIGMDLTNNMLVWDPLPCSVGLENTSLKMSFVIRSSTETGGNPGHVPGRESKPGIVDLP